MIDKDLALDLNNFCDHYNLTQGEKKVLEHLIQYKQKHIITYYLNIKEGTLKFHYNNIFRKTNVLSRNELLIEFIHFSYSYKKIA